MSREFGKVQANEALADRHDLAPLVLELFFQQATEASVSAFVHLAWCENETEQRNAFQCCCCFLCRSSSNDVEKTNATYTEESQPTHGERGWCVCVWVCGWEGMGGGLVIEGREMQERCWAQWRFYHVSTMSITLKKKTAIFQTTCLKRSHSAYDTFWYSADQWMHSVSAENDLIKGSMKLLFSGLFYEGVSPVSSQYIR